MSKGAYIGVSSKARKVKKAYIGVGGKARKVKKAYIGDSNGKARLWWSGGTGMFVGVNATTIYTIDHDYNIQYFTGPILDGNYPSTIECLNGLYFVCGANNSTTQIMCSYSRNLSTWTNFKVNQRQSTKQFVGSLINDSFLYVLWTNSSDTLVIATIDINTLSVISEYPTRDFVYMNSTYGGYCFAPDGKNIMFVGISSGNIGLFIYNVDNHETNVYNTSVGNVRLRKTSYYNGKTLIDYGTIRYCTVDGVITTTVLSNVSNCNNYLYYKDILISSYLKDTNYKLAKSINFNAWNDSNLIPPSWGFSYYGRNLAYGDGKYLVYYEKSNGKFFYMSSDGLTWTEILYGKNLTDICYTISRGYGDN